MTTALWVIAVILLLIVLKLDNLYHKSIHAENQEELREIVKQLELLNKKLGGF